MDGIYGNATTPPLIIVAIEAKAKIIIVCVCVCVCVFVVDVIISLWLPFACNCSSISTHLLCLAPLANPRRPARHHRLTPPPLKPRTSSTSWCWVPSVAHVVTAAWCSSGEVRRRREEFIREHQYCPSRYIHFGWHV